jgi:hypothetical protein
MTQEEITSELARIGSVYAPATGWRHADPAAGKPLVNNPAGSRSAAWGPRGERGTVVCTNCGKHGQERGAVCDYCGHAV